MVESPSDFSSHLSALDPKRKKGLKSGKMLNEETNVENVFSFKAHIFLKIEIISLPKIKGNMNKHFTSCLFLEKFIPMPKRVQIVVVISLQ